MPNKILQTRLDLANRYFSRKTHPTASGVDVGEMGGGVFPQYPEARRMRHGECRGQIIVVDPDASICDSCRPKTRRYPLSLSTSFRVNIPAVRVNWSDDSRPVVRGCEITMEHVD